MSSTSKSSSKPSGLVLDPEVLMDSIKNHSPSQKNSELGIILTEVEDCSPEHTKHREKMVTSFLNFLLQHPKYEGYMDFVDVQGLHMPRLWASVMREPEGTPETKTRSKSVLANSMLVDFAVSLVMKKPGKDGCPFYQPSSQNQMMRTLLAAMHDDYMWDYTMEKSFNFKGGVQKVLNELYQVRMKKYPRVSVKIGIR